MEAALPRQPEPGKWLSALFSLLMHALLALCLFYGVQWQRRTPEPVMVELVRSLPPPTVKPAVVAETPPPRPVPRPVVKEEPEPPKPVKPDIALKEPKPEKKPEKPKEPPKVEPKKPEVKKPEPKTERKPDSAVDPMADHISKLLNQEANKVATINDKQRLAQELNRVAKIRADSDAKAARSSASDEWRGRISNKVRNNINRAALTGVTGNPEATFELVLLPDGSIVDNPRLVKSSGFPHVDNEIYRAILKSSPLPLPSKNEIFVRNLTLVFHPLED